MGIMAMTGALVITLSLLFHSRIPTRVSPIELREHQPSKILVGVRGTMTEPAFFGFLAIVNPKSQVLSVVPVSGKLLVNGVPLYVATAGKTAKEDAALVSRATGVPFHSYFFLTASDLTLVLNALYYHTGHWPTRDTPSTMLNNLGYPYGPSHGWNTVNLLSRIVQTLPSVSPIAASHLLGVTKTSVTNLTSYQLFLLANYIRGDNLQLGHMADFRSYPARRHHG
jgi:hypothetical protein